MGNNTHTAGPWCVTGDGDVTSIRSMATDEVIATIEWDGEPEGIANTNARRIAACVNACESIPTANLESGALAELIEAVKKAHAMMAMPERIEPRHRDELRASLARVMP